MRRDEVLHLLNAHRTDLARFGVRSLAFFGSVARDEARPDSDIDFLVEFAEPANFTDFMNLKFFLEDLLGSRVDLVTQQSLKPRIRPQVEKEAIHVAGF